MYRLKTIMTIILVLTSVTLFAQTTLTSDTFIFVEQRQTVQGTSTSGTIYIDFPTYYCYPSTQQITSQTPLTLTEATKMIGGKFLSISGFGGGISSSLTLSDTLSVGPFTASTDGTVTVDYNGASFTLAPGQSWSETTQLSTFLGLSGTFTSVVTINNYGIWPKANITAPTPYPTIDPTPDSTPEVTPSTDLLCGDANGDGEVTIVDALLIAQYYVGKQLPVFRLDYVDANGDATINIVDALYVAQYYVGLRTSLDCWN